MRKSTFQFSYLKFFTLALFLIVFSTSCDSGGGGGEGGGGQGAQVPSACDSFTPTITGTSGNDVINGTDGPDIIVGLGGHDTIDGMGGNDRICGGRGNDNILGGNGNDILDGGPDDDVVDGQAGDDIILEDPGSDDILVGPDIPNFDIPFRPSQDEISFTNADESISLDMTSQQEQRVNEAGDTITIEGFFPNIYGSFNPDTIFFSNTPRMNGAIGHLFDPSNGAGTDVFIVDANGSQANVIQEASFFEVGGGAQVLQGDRTIRVGNTVYNTIGVENIRVFNHTPYTIDNGDPGYSQGGFTAQPAQQGFQGDFDFSLPNDGNTAAWSFTDLPNGPYIVSTTWDPFTDRATDAPYRMQDGGAPVEVKVDQQEAPDDFEDDGAVWESLAVINVTNNELTVELSDDADNAVIADAVRLTPLPFAGASIFDNDNSEVQSLFTPNIAPLGTLDGTVGSQAEIPGNQPVSLSLDEAAVQRLNDAISAFNSKMFIISIAYVPQPGASEQLRLTVDLNGNTVSRVIDQTGIDPDIQAAKAAFNAANQYLCYSIGDDVKSLRMDWFSEDGRPYVIDTVIVSPQVLVPGIRLEEFTLPEVDESMDELCIQF